MKTVLRSSVEQYRVYDFPLYIHGVGLDFDSNTLWKYEELGLNSHIKLQTFTRRAVPFEGCK